MSGELCLCNRQRVRNVDMRLFRRVVDALLASMGVGEYDLTIQLVGEKEMKWINETRLRHAGSTDVITFDYGERNGPMTGEIFVCVSEAVALAARFRAIWQEEVVRYTIHGILHLRDFDDVRTAARRRMKREEGRWLKRLAGDFRLSKLGGKPKVTA